MIFGRSAVILSALVLATAAAASDWTFDALEAALKNDVRERVSFTEVREIGYLQEPLQSSGVMTLDGDVLRKQVTAPSAQTFEIRGDELIHSAGGEVEARMDIGEHPVVQSLIVTFRALLSGRIEPLREYFNLNLSGTRDDWTLSMYPHVERIRDALAAVKMRGAGGSLRELVFSETNGDRTLIKIDHD